MLLKFTSPDMLNTTLVDVATDKCAYNIVTVAESIPSERTISPPNDSCTPLASTSNIRSPTMVGSSPSFTKKQHPCDSDPSSIDQRHTTITDASGTILAEVHWRGRRPTISLGEEKVGALTDLFGSSTVRFMFVSSSVSNSVNFLILTYFSGQKSSLSPPDLIQSMFGWRHQILLRCVLPSTVYFTRLDSHSCLLAV